METINRSSKKSINQSINTPKIHKDTQTRTHTKREREERRRERERANRKESGFLHATGEAEAGNAEVDSDGVLNRTRRNGQNDFSCREKPRKRKCRRKQLRGKDTRANRKQSRTTQTACRTADSQSTTKQHTTRSTVPKHIATFIPTVNSDGDLEGGGILIRVLNSHGDRGLPLRLGNNRQPGQRGVQHLRNCEGRVATDDGRSTIDQSTSPNQPASQPTNSSINQSSNHHRLARALTIGLVGRSGNKLKRATAASDRPRNRVILTKQRRAEKQRGLEG